MFQSTLNAKVHKEFTKVIEKEHTIGQAGELDIESKYGNINVTTWNKESVAVKAVITVKAKSESDANELLEYINIEFQEGSNYLKCLTINSFQENYTWKDYLPWNISNYKTLEYSIEYTVQMPHSADLNIENKHGNIGLADLGGSADIEQKYGNLSAKDIKGNLKLYLKHGNGTVGSVADLRGELGYSNFTLNKANVVNLESKHSNVEIKEAITLQLESRYDNFEIGTIEEINIDCRYSDYDIEKVSRLTIIASYSDIVLQHLDESVQAELKYGDFDVRDLKSYFKDISIISSYTDVDIDIDETIEFDLDVEGEHLDVPEKLFKLRSGIFTSATTLVIKSKIKEVSIKTKEKVQGIPRIKAIMKYGSFNVQ